MKKVIEYLNDISHLFYSFMSAHLNFMQASDNFHILQNLKYFLAQDTCTKLTRISAQYSLLFLSFYTEN